MKYKHIEAILEHCKISHRIMTIPPAGLEDVKEITFVDLNNWSGDWDIDNEPPLEVMRALENWWKENVKHSIRSWKFEVCYYSDKTSMASTGKTSWKAFCELPQIRDLK